jgi:hypothetical protein
MDDHYMYKWCPMWVQTIPLFKGFKHCKHKYLTCKTRGNNVEYIKIKYYMPGTN